MTSLTDDKEVLSISFQTFFVWALLLIVHTWNSCPLWSNLLRMQCTSLTSKLKITHHETTDQIKKVINFLDCARNQNTIHWKIRKLLVLSRNCLLFIYLFILFTNPSAREGYDARSIFKRSLTGFNSEFSFS